MATVTVTNEPDDIIDELVATLAGGTWAVLETSVFDYVNRSASVQAFKDSRLTQSPSCAVILNSVEEYEITDLRIGCVADLTILIASTEDTESDRVVDITKLIGAVKNLINADVPDDAEAFFQDDSEEVTPRIEWGEPDSDTESSIPWQYTELPLRIAFVTTNSTSH